MYLQQDQYHDEINKRRHPKVTQSKEMILNVAKREYNAIKKLIDDRDKFAEKHAKLQWDEARRKALRKKRADIRRAEKEAKQAAKADDKSSKKGRMGPRSKTIQPDAGSTAASSSARPEGQSVVRALFRNQFDYQVEDDDAAIFESSSVAGERRQQQEQQQQQEEEKEDDVEEVINPRPSTSRSGPAPKPGNLPATPRRSRAYLPDTGVESRFGVILTELKSIWKEINSIKLDNDRELRVSLTIDLKLNFILYMH